MRNFGEDINCPLIRINPSEWEVGQKCNISLRMGAMDALIQISALNKRQCMKYADTNDQSVEASSEFYRSG